MKVRQGIFDEYDKKIMDISGIHTMSTLDLEFKENEVFETWKDSTLYLKVIKHQKDTEYTMSSLMQMQFEIVSVDFKEDTVEMLEIKLATLLDIPVEKVIIILRHERGYDGTVTAEYFNMDWRKPKVLSQASKFEHGFYLFVEENSHTEKFDNFEWVKLFKAEQDLMSVSVNNPE
jgi:histidyl-tRNA synthetase